MKKQWFVLLALLVLAGLALVGCGSGEPETVAVRVQLQWVAQSQFAGYYAALAEGYYEEEGLDVTILEGAPDIVPQQVCVNGGAEFCTAWVPKALESNEAGADLVNIAQIYQRSGTLEVSFADAGITSVADLAGRNVGVWDFGNEHEVFAALRGEGLDPESDVNIVIQPFDMTLLLTGEIDAAEAMIYNEYAQVLEAINPATGELYQPEDLNVIDFNEVGTAMLQDAVWVTESWIGEDGNEDVAERFLRATFRGWIFCRDNFDACVEHVLDAGTTLGESHMRWQLNEVNALIWPSPGGIGVMDQALWDQTVAVAIEGGVLTAEPADSSFRVDLAQAALEGLDGDTTGNNFSKIEVELVEGGE
ncbi:MAG: ABC transporter substrate-binding protein [Anaerolineales bacterium]|nr:ABC transporter substrate-binding protein [Anaerolineales bacterium]MCB0012111.1 ABC transporter substrate-binding protein [Anaerolineales bacterium]